MALALNTRGRILKKGNRGAEVAGLVAWLRRYGYLRPSDHPDTAGWNRATKKRLARIAVFDEALEEAVATYQELHGIEPTGELTAETRRHMASPRCGRPDASTQGIPTLPDGPGAGGQPWPTRELSFRFVNQNPAVPAASVESAFGEACASWSSAVAPSLRFTRMDVGANIRIAWFRDHHGSAPDIAFDGLGRQLAHAWGLPSPFAGEIHLDLAETWSGNTPATGNADLCTQLTHELGHVLGLPHSFDRTSVMFPSFAPGEIKRVLSASDIMAIRRLYP